VDCCSVYCGSRISYVAGAGCGFDSGVYYFVCTSYISCGCRVSCRTRTINNGGLEGDLICFLVIGVMIELAESLSAV